MRKRVVEYVRECGSCQRQTGSREYTAPVGDLVNPVGPYEVTSMDITGPYPLTPRKNRYLLTFVDHITIYAEIFPIQDQSALTCARVYASQTVTRHGSGSRLITDEGSAFMLFFNETCKVLGI
jgi:hypothetical protein